MATPFPSSGHDCSLGVLGEAGCPLPPMVKPEALGLEFLIIRVFGASLESSAPSLYEMCSL